MTYKLHNDLRQIVHPYMFVLKEGQDFHSDCLDYSLMLLHVNCLETFPSPRFEQIAATISRSAIANLAHSAPEQSEVSQVFQPVLPAIK
jgi:hypothetical protein